ncbi:hypothetical protein IAE37_005333 [Pseudomonas sp. S31]|uniref:hypothetical protein n=1 Tax=Pseudomonas sp. S31 TaxID=1564473 RepID=UPI001911DDA5|nr:hypothetical protein [Pseudomonas sp. S31]MBK5003057.1 hypothetical protein [Pseudomonas sp. S31]
MSRALPVVVALLILASWLAASYGVRYGLMENGQWVGLCAEARPYWQCQARALLGLTIYHQVLAWAGLGLALVAQLLSGRVGSWLAGLALVFAVPAMVLYTASIAVFAVVLAGLRLVRRPLL